MDEFSHGGYGDYSGVNFYGPPIDGYWNDSLSISDFYIIPIFSTIQTHATPVPRLVAEWTRLEGWTNASGRVAIPNMDVQDLVAAFDCRSLSELSPPCEWGTPERCLECATTIANFLRSRIAVGKSLYIERE